MTQSELHQFCVKHINFVKSLAHIKTSLTRYLELHARNRDSKIMFRNAIVKALRALLTQAELNFEESSFLCIEQKHSLRFKASLFCNVLFVTL